MESLVFDESTWNHLTVCQQMDNIKPFNCVQTNG